jgi:hypothetical protein
MMFAPVFEQTAASLVDAFVVRAREIKARASGGGDAGFAGYAAPSGRSDGRDDDRSDADGADGGDGGGD